MKANLNWSLYIKRLLSGFALAVRHKIHFFLCKAGAFVTWRMAGMAFLPLLLMSAACHTTNGAGKVRTYTLRVLGETGLSFEGEWMLNGVKKTVEGAIPAIFEIRSAELECSFRRLDKEGLILLRVTEGLKVWGETIAEEPKTTVGATIRADGATWFISY